MPFTFPPCPLCLSIGDGCPACQANGTTPEVKLPFGGKKAAPFKKKEAPEVKPADPAPEVKPADPAT